MPLSSPRSVAGAQRLGKSQVRVQLPARAPNCGTAANSPVTSDGELRMVDKLNWRSAVLTRQRLQVRDLRRPSLPHGGFGSLGVFVTGATSGLPRKPRWRGARLVSEKWPVRPRRETLKSTSLRLCSTVIVSVAPSPSKRVLPKLEPVEACFVRCRVRSCTELHNPNQQENPTASAPSARRDTIALPRKIATVASLACGFALAGVIAMR